jgi:hypothetical protein
MENLLIAAPLKETPGLGRHDFQSVRVCRTKINIRDPSPFYHSEKLTVIHVESPW